MNEPINHGIPMEVQLQWRRRPRNGAGEVYTKIRPRRAWRSCRLGLTRCRSGTSVDTITLYHLQLRHAILRPSWTCSCVVEGIGSGKDMFYDIHLNLPHDSGDEGVRF